MTDMHLLGCGFIFWCWAEAPAVEACVVVGPELNRRMELEAHGISCCCTVNLQGNRGVDFRHGNHVLLVVCQLLDLQSPLLGVSGLAYCFYCTYHVNRAGHYRAIIHRCDVFIHADLSSLL